MSGGYRIDPALIEEARGWLADCQWADMEPEDFADVPERDIVLAVQRYYDGGWSAFEAAST